MFVITENIFFFTIALLAVIQIYSGARITNFLVIPNSDNYWINCDYNLTANEWLNYLSISKDSHTFYRYNNYTQLYSVSGINSGQIWVYSPGNVMLRGVTTPSINTFGCELSARNRTGSVIVQTASRRVVFTSLTPTIINFTVPSVIKINNNYWLNCSFANGGSHGLISLSMAKNGHEFYYYNFVYNTVSVNSIPGVNLTVTGNTFTGMPGVLSVRNATKYSAGNYTCTLSWLTVNLLTGYRLNAVTVSHYASVMSLFAFV